MTGLRDWLEARRPVVPDALRDWLVVDDDLPLSVDALVELGIAELERAEVTRRLDRNAAFHLLAADAFFTYACEAATDEPGAADIASRLSWTLDRCAAAWL